MVDLQTAIEELNTGKIEFDYKSDDCCTTEGEVVILLKRLAELEKENNRQKAEIEYLQKEYIPEIASATKRTDELAFEEMRKTARLQEESERYKHSIMLLEKDVQTAKSEAIKELGEKITEVFLRYAHLHSYAEGARKDYIETVDGKEIEMQSVWDVITLQMNGMAEYEEMGRLQKNIEIIEKERLLTELEKDFRLLVKEMVGE